MAELKPPKPGNIYRIKRRYERPGPPFIRVITVSKNHMKVVDYMQDGQLAKELGWGAHGFKAGGAGQRVFSDWSRLKYWRLVR